MHSMVQMQVLHRKLNSPTVHESLQLAEQVQPSSPPTVPAAASRRSFGLRQIHRRSWRDRWTCRRVSVCRLCCRGQFAARRERDGETWTRVQHMLHGSASVCIVHGGHFGGRRRAGPQWLQHRAADVDASGSCQSRRDSWRQFGTRSERREALAPSCTAQLVCVSFMVGISEVGAAPGRPSTATAAPGLKTRP